MKKLNAFLTGVLSGRAGFALLIVLVILAAMLTPFSWSLLLFGIGYGISMEIYAMLQKKLRTLSKQSERQFFAACVVINLMVACYLYLRYQSNGFAICLQLVWAVMAFDTFALIGGKLTGQFWETHKIAVKVSPGKSWEGYLVGLVAGICSLGISGLVLQRFGVTPVLFPLQHGWMMALALSFGHSGDFAKSAFKRWVGVKDSGTLLGGHGGVLDRFDAFTCVGLAGLVMKLAGVF